MFLNRIRAVAKKSLMPTSGAGLVIKKYCETNQSILTFLQKLSDEELHRRLSPAHQSIAFHAWHVARWTDFTQACIPGMTPGLGRSLPPGTQIWEAQRLADSWGFGLGQPGFADTGWTMSDLVSALSMTK